MAIIGISITKRCAFRDGTQEFSNVYHYKVLTLPNATAASALIDEIVTTERDLHSTLVTFVRGRCWSAGGTKQENQMILQKNLSGTGNQSSLANLDRERAFLVMWTAGLDTRGRQVYLRKWYHSCGHCASQIPAQGVIENTTGLTQAQRDAVAAKAQEVEVLDAGQYQLCAESGRESTAVSATAHKYLEHHQFGDMWRAQ